MEPGFSYLALIYFTGVVGMRRDRSLCGHETLVDALRRHDADGAAAMAREHVAATCRDVLETPSMAARV